LPTRGHPCGGGETVRFPPACAGRKLLNAAKFYESQAAGLGEDFLAEAERILELVAATPEPGMPYVGGENTRRVLLPRFPFAVVYQTEPELILVVAVAHQRRRPGYWRDRV
jgi:toxin ParE1/3/4